MSVSDLGMLADMLQGLLSHLPSIDIGYLLTLAGSLIIGVFVLYVLGVLVVRGLRWIASLTPYEFARFMLALGVIMLVAGLIVP